MFEKCKYVSEVGAEQLLVDVYSIKGVLVSMLSMGAKEKVIPAPAFIKILEKGVGKIELPVKVVAAPYLNPDQFIKVFTDIYGPEHNEPDLTAVLGLKAYFFN